MAPHLDLSIAPRQPPIYTWLGPNRDTRNIHRSPSPDSLEPRAFVQHPQQALFPPRFNGGHGKGKAKRQDQDEGPYMQRGKKNRKDCRQPANFASVAVADHAGMQPQQDPPSLFHDLMESPFTNHDYPVKHLYKDCLLRKRLLR